jgi:hypothetical protein
LAISKTQAAENGPGKAVPTAGQSANYCTVDRCAPNDLTRQNRAPQARVHPGTDAMPGRHRAGTIIWCSPSWPAEPPDTSPARGPSTAPLVRAIGLRCGISRPGPCRSQAEQAASYRDEDLLSRRQTCVLCASCAGRFAGDYRTAADHTNKTCRAPKGPCKQGSVQACALSCKQATGAQEQIGRPGPRYGIRSR